MLRRARRDRLDEPGITPAVHWKLREIALGGADVALRAALAGVPWLLRHLVELPAVGTAQAAFLVRQLGIVTLADLEIALEEGRIGHALTGADVERLTAAAAALRLEAARVPLGRALDLLDGFVQELAASAPQLTGIVVAGDVRRFEPIARDLVVVASAADPPVAADAVCAGRAISDVTHHSPRRAIVNFQHAEIDVRIAAPDEYGTVLFGATGSRGHVRAVAGVRGRPRLWPREEDVYRQAGLAYIPAEMRNGTGEVEAASQGALPALVAARDIRGDLHMHSTFSDGRDTMAQMIAACCELGYEYVAITDHSQGAAASRTVSADDLARQGEEIARLRETFPQIAILHGIEVDILLDGSLDFPDRVIEPLDLVLASMHESGRQDARTLTRRCIQAIRHPLVAVLTHPANRLVGRDEGYALDWEAVFAAAAESRTALEIDGGPAHLDLDGERARAAVAAGVTLVVDSDCHRARSLGRQMQMAVGTARRGWVEPRHVLNARPLAEVRAFVAAKRGTRP